MAVKRKKFGASFRCMLQSKLPVIFSNAERLFLHVPPPTLEPGMKAGGTSAPYLAHTRAC